MDSPIAMTPETDTGVPGQDKRRSVLYFDGVCNLCSSLVQFVVAHSQNEQILFCSLQSEEGEKIRRSLGLVSVSPETVVFVKNQQPYVMSTAILELFREMGGVWKWLYFFRFLPLFVRDGLYRVVARNRYRWFGKKEVCWLPDPALSHRFVK